MPPSVRTLPALLDHAAAVAGARAGAACGDERLGWEEVRARAHGFARALVAAGIDPGDRIATYLEPSVDAVVALFGIACAGAVAVPIQGKLRDAQVAHVLADSGAKLVVTSPDKEAYLHAAERTFAGVTRVRTGGGGSERFAEWCAAEDGVLPEVGEDDLAVLLYTSGSTGRAKGVMQDQRNLVLGAEIVCGYLGLDPADRILAVLPLGFDYGLNQVLDAAWLGAEVALHAHLTVHDLAAAVERHRATVLAGVPSLWAQVAAALVEGKVDRARLASLRVLTSSGGRLYERDVATLRAALPHAGLFSMYGLTEAFRSSYLPPSELARRPRSIGKAIPGVELLVVDPASGRRCAPGEVGELVHAGALVARGYWNDPAATAARFRPHPFRPDGGTVVFSGDLVRTDDEGFLYFVARADAQLKVAGHRVSPEEVELVIHAVPGVRAAVVVGLDDAARADTRLVACVVGDHDGDLCERVRAACRRALPPYMVPVEIRLLPSIPLNANGKPDRAAVVRALREGA